MAKATPKQDQALINRIRSDLKTLAKSVPNEGIKEGLEFFADQLMLEQADAIEEAYQHKRDYQTPAKYDGK